MLEAALRRPSNDELVNIELAVDELATSSMIEVLRPVQREEPRWINVPGAAFAFGTARLPTHRSASTVMMDRQYISLLGPTKNTSVEAEEVDLTFFFSRARDSLLDGSLPQRDLLDVIDHLSSSTNNAWRLAVRVLADAGKANEARRLIMRDAPSDIQTWALDDLRFRYDLLRKLHDSRTVETALVLLPKLLRDREYGTACLVVSDFWAAIERNLLTIKESQKGRVAHEIFSPFRRVIQYVDAPAAEALAGLASITGLEDYREEAQMWSKVASDERK
jgi:hypothetical protein